MTEEVMRPHAKYDLYNTIKEQIPKRPYGRHPSVQNKRINMTIPNDDNSAISLNSRGRVIFHLISDEI